MSLTVYKSNKTNKGSLFSIKFAAKSNKQDEPFKPGGFFVNIVKQTGWNDQKHIGKFSGGDNISFKLDQFEAGAILHVIEKNWNIEGLTDLQKDRKTLAERFGFVGKHGSGGNMTYINFVPWQRQESQEQTGFAFSVTKTADGTNTSFGTALDFGQATALREYLKLGLEHINMAGYAEDKRRAEESFKSKENGDTESERPEAPKSRSTGRTARPKVTPEPQEEPEAETPAENDEEPLF